MDSIWLSFRVMARSAWLVLTHPLLIVAFVPVLFLMGSLRGLAEFAIATFESYKWLDRSTAIDLYSSSRAATVAAWPLLGISHMRACLSVARGEPIRAMGVIKGVRRVPVALPYSIAISLLCVLVPWGWYYVLVVVAGLTFLLPAIVADTDDSIASCAHRSWRVAHDHLVGGIVMCCIFTYVSYLAYRTVQLALFFIWPVCTMSIALYYVRTQTPAAAPSLAPPRAP